MRTCAVIAMLCLVLAAAASADERLVTDGPVESVTAGGGWVLWHDSGGGTMLWHDGQSMPSHGPFLEGLGTDRNERAVGLFETCGRDALDCVVRHRLLPDGPSTKGFDPPFDPHSWDESHGTLLLAAPGRLERRRIYMKRPDEPLRQIGDLRAGGVSISSGAMSNFVGLNSRYRLFAAARGTTPRWHQLAAWNEVADFDREPGTYRRIGFSTTDGRYAYWLEQKVTFDEHGFGQGSARTRVLRVNPGASDRHVEAFTPPRRVFDFAVTRGRLYYLEREDGAVYEYRRPPFERTGETLPIRG